MTCIEEVKRIEELDHKQIRCPKCHEEFELTKDILSEHV
jgi:ribosomal protein L37AE/L43A